MYLPVRQTRLLKDKFLEQKYPDKVYPTEYQTENGNDNAHYKSDKSAFLEEGGPSYDDFGNPVYAGDEQQKQLYKAALSVKPSHFHVSLF